MPISWPWRLPPPIGFSRPPGSLAVPVASLRARAPASSQPLTPHEHWHVDFSYLNIGGVFYFLCAVLDGCSRMILAWDIRPTMREIDAEIVLQKAREAYPEARPRIITDQGSQFKGREFKAFIAQ